MRAALLIAVLFVSTPLLALEPALAPGEELEIRLDADLDGDGSRDIAYVARAEDSRALHVMLANNGAEYLSLDPYPLGAGMLTFAKGVLVFEDLTGGTTAYSVTRRYRFDEPANRMRLIGYDATLYSRTFAHDGFELSWNLLTSKLITRELRLNRKGSDAAYDPIVERTRLRRAGKVWLFDTPDPETLMTAVRAR